MYMWWTNILLVWLPLFHFWAFEDPSDLIIVLPVGDTFQLNQRPASPRGHSMPRQPDFLFSASSSRRTTTVVTKKEEEDKGMTWLGWTQNWANYRQKCNSRPQFLRLEKLLHRVHSHELNTEGHKYRNTDLQRNKNITRIQNPNISKRFN